MGSLTVLICAVCLPLQASAAVVETEQESGRKEIDRKVVVSREEFVPNEYNFAALPNCPMEWKEISAANFPSAVEAGACDAGDCPGDEADHCCVSPPQWVDQYFWNPSNDSRCRRCMSFYRNTTKYVSFH